MALVQAELDALRVPYLWFNQRRFAAVDFAFTIQSTGAVNAMFAVDGVTWDLSRFSGVYQRLTNHRVLPELAEEPENSPLRVRCGAFHHALRQWLDVVDPAVTRAVNRPSAMASNSSQPYQAQIIAHHGLLVPPTLITNDPEHVHDFRTGHRTVIYKSISGVRSIVRTLEESDLRRLEAIRWCPTQFQAFISGTHVRVHVIGGELFATAIRTDGIDYRYARREGRDEGVVFQPYALPDDTAARCIETTAALGLDFSGIDLKITPDGRVYCLETNPSPAFSYYQARTGQPIARAVARYLQGRGRQ